MTRTLILAGAVTLASVGDAYAQSTLQRCLGVVPGQSPPRTKARIAWETKKREYEDCRSTRRDNCYEPGPAPR